MANDNIEAGPIVVSNSTLSHLSQGIYRSTAAALKELISNAYDADATEVLISTNYPYYSYILCEDDGEGMTKEAFREHFANKGVGTSHRRWDGKDRTEKYNRPIIGRLGIGLFAIGQITKSFKIESHYEREGVKSAFRAEITLSDKGIPTTDEQIKETNKDDFVAGKFKLKDIEFDPEKKGFRIFSDDVRVSFIDEMERSENENPLDGLPFITAELHKKYFGKGNRTISGKGPYLQAIWELSMLCPLPYFGELPKYPIDISKFRKKEKETEGFEKAINLLKEKQKEFESQNFKVRFEGINLKRFVELPTTNENYEDLKPKLYYFEFDDKVYGERLKFRGYIFGQASQHIRPMELNGIQIRLRNVGIGCYDRTFLNYVDVVETMRSRWISGEIFVEYGLESALNLDRDSFNEHDEHYRTLQRELHSKLYDLLTDLEKLGKERRRGIQERKEEDYYSELKHTIEEDPALKQKVKFEQLGRKKTTITEEENEIVVNTDPGPLRGKTRNKVYKAVMLAFDIALQSENKEEQKKVFDRLLKELLEAVL